MNETAPSLYSVEHTDRYGTRYRVEYASTPLNFPDGGEMLSDLWSLVEGLYRAAGYTSEPRAVLAENVFGLTYDNDGETS